MEIRLFITGERFKEKMMTNYGFEKGVYVYPTNRGNLTINEIAVIIGISRIAVATKISRGGLGPEPKKMGRPIRAKNSTKMEKSPIE